MIRTRAIISRLSYDDLVKQGVIPDLMPHISQSPTVTATKRYPPFVYAGKDFAFFGMLLDYIVRAGLRINLQQPLSLGTDPNADVIQQLPDAQMLDVMQHLSKYETSRNLNEIARASLTLTSTMYGKSSYTQEEIQAYVPTMVNIIKEIVAKWNILGTYLNGTIRFNTEYVHGVFSGHPDIVTDQCILDIKNTSSFPKMAKESCLQVLAYYALMKPTHPAVQYVGFVLPMQRDIAIYNLGNWNPARYLQVLSEEANKLEATTPKKVDEDDTVDLAVLMEQLEALGIDQTQLMELLGPQTQTRIIIGGHIAKGKNIATTLRDFAAKYPGRPCQMFLGNPRTGKQDNKTAEQVQEAARVIRETGLNYFTHAAYVINLCANQCDNGDYWQQRYLNEDLRLTAAMGGKGVVVHTGARKHLSEAEGLHIMEYMVRTALPYATEQCPLLLETPCGEGTEILTKIEDLGNFFFRFNEEDRKKLGLCVDTCHVFAAGYDPLLYLQHWEKYCPVPVKLVHFNDSQGACGSCVDRHAHPGSGNIGMKKLQEVAVWCHERSIPMVRE